MKAYQFFGAALLGLAVSFSAHAQTPTVGMPGTSITPGTPASPAAGTVMPGQPSTTIPTMPAGTAPATTTPAATVPANATTPIGSSGQLYPNGVPTRNVDAGTLRTDQPVSGNPAIPGSQPTRRLNKARTTKTTRP